MSTRGNHEILGLEGPWEPFQKQVMLELKAEGLLDTIGEEPSQAMQALLAECPVETVKLTQTDILQRNAKACMIINNHLNPHLLDLFGHYDVALELWNALKNRCGSRN